MRKKSHAHSYAQTKNSISALRNSNAKSKTLRSNCYVRRQKTTQKTQLPLMPAPNFFQTNAQAKKNLLLYVYPNPNPATTTTAPHAQNGRYAQDFNVELENKNEFHG